MPDPTTASTANQPTYVEEPAYYPFVIALTADEHVDNVAVNIDRDSDFLLTGLNGDSDGDFTMNFRLPSGRQISTSEIKGADILGTPNQPTAIGPPPIYRAGSVGPQVTLTDISANTNKVTIIFSGIRRIRTT